MVLRGPIILRLVRDGASYRNAMFLVEAAEGKLEYSGELKSLIQRFISAVSEHILPAAQRSGGKTEFPHANPEDEIRNELLLFRQNNYGDVEELAKLLADNVQLWGMSLSSLTPRGGAENALLLTYVVNAIDRAILIATRDWWNKQEGVSEISENLYRRVTAGVGGDAYPLDPLPCVILRVASYEEVKSELHRLRNRLDYKSSVVMGLTDVQLESLSKFEQSQPGHSLADLNVKFPPIAKIGLPNVQRAVREEPALLLANVAPLIQGLGKNSNLASLIQASLEAAVSHNIAQLAGDPEFASKFTAPPWRTPKSLHRSKETVILRPKGTDEDPKPPDGKGTVLERPRPSKASYIDFVSYKELAH